MHMVKCEIRKICEYCNTHIYKFPLHTVRVMDPDMKSNTENNICGLNCINVPPKQNEEKYSDVLFYLIRL